MDATATALKVGDRVRLLGRNPHAQLRSRLGTLHQWNDAFKAWIVALDEPCLYGGWGSDDKWVQEQRTFVSWGPAYLEKLTEVE